jgi:hypothetical protein
VGHLEELKGVDMELRLVVGFLDVPVKTCKEIPFEMSQQSLSDSFTPPLRLALGGFELLLRDLDLAELRFTAR